MADRPRLAAEGAQKLAPPHIVVAMMIRVERPAWRRCGDGRPHEDPENERDDERSQHHQCGLAGAGIISASAFGVTAATGIRQFPRSSIAL